jgi:Fur family transcriptional regulator, ferric uptake regulator
MSERNLKQTLVSLLQVNHLLSAGAMLEKLASQGKNYNKTSVYRALDQLELENMVCRHHFNEAEADYELREHHHAHLVCTHCGQVESGECTYVEPTSIGAFKVDHHHTTLFGTCEKCSAKIAK